MPTTIAGTVHTELRVIRPYNGLMYEYAIGPSLRTVVNSTERWVCRIINRENTPKHVGVIVNGNGHFLSPVIKVGTKSLDEAGRTVWVKKDGDLTMNGVAAPTAPFLSQGQFNGYLAPFSFIEVEGDINWQVARTDPYIQVGAELPGELGYAAPPLGPGFEIPKEPEEE